MTCVYFIITYVLVGEYFKYEIQKALGPRLSPLLFPVRVNTHVFLTSQRFHQSPQQGGECHRAGEDAEAMFKLYVTH